MSDKQRKMVAAARGIEILDLLITNVNLVNVYTGEIYPVEIGIYADRIVRVSQPNQEPPNARLVFDGNGQYAVPGLIDTHVHIESSMMTPSGFCEAVIPLGTTTVVIDPHEIGNVFGLRGVEYMLEATAKLPLRVYVQAPSSVPAVPGLETAGAEFGPQEIEEMLGWKRVIGLAEVMDYVGVINQSIRMEQILDAAIAKNTVISGHCPEVIGSNLAAYLVGGPNSDHEGRDLNEILEKLRSGMIIEARVSSFSESISVVAALYQKLGQIPPNLVLCTDDIYPNDLLRHGHLDEVVRQGIKAGINPIDMIRAGTLHGANRHRLYDLGALAPGKKADILLVQNLNEFRVNDVFIGGVHVASQGKLIVDIEETKNLIESENSILIRKDFRASDFVISSQGKDTIRKNILVISRNLRRSIATEGMNCLNGQVDIGDQPDICFASIFERHGKNGNHAIELIRGLGVRYGAAASTVAHDCHNLVVVGRNPEDMAIAANYLIKCGGGICSVVDGEIIATLELPVAGLMSSQKLSEVSDQLEKLNLALKKQGFYFDQPLTGLLSLALPVIPSYGLTDIGLVDVEKQCLLDLPE